MTVRGFALVLVSLAVIGQLIRVGGSAAAQEKKEKANPKTGLDDTTTALMTVVEEAFKAHDYRKDPKHGNGKTPFEEIPTKPGLIVGFEIFPGVKDKTTQYVRGVKPIWLMADGKKYIGKSRGWIGDGTGMVKVEAKPGYAVAGLKVHTDFGEIAGLCVVFAKIVENGLDMSDSYDSKYYGHNDPETAKRVVCNGDPIIGIHGLIADNYKSHDFGLGLVVLGRDEGKRKKK
jgi:hypothetical protein